MEPTSSAAAGFISTKVAAGLSALFMATVVMFVSKKPMLKGKTRLATGAIVGGIAVGSSVIFVGVIAIIMGMNPNDVNVASGIGGIIGLVALTVIKAAVLWLDKFDDKDIAEVISEVAQDVNSIKTGVPVKKPVAKKTPAQRKRIAK
jgi:hypothetical protein